MSNSQNHLPKESQDLKTSGLEITEPCFSESNPSIWGFNDSSGNRYGYITKPSGPKLKVIQNLTLQFIQVEHLRFSPPRVGGLVQRVEVPGKNPVIFKSIFYIFQTANICSIFCFGHRNSFLLPPAKLDRSVFFRYRTWVWTEWCRTPWMVTNCILGRQQIRRWSARIEWQTWQVKWSNDSTKKHEFIPEEVLFLDVFGAFCWVQGGYLVP